jgi:hypothetical protein
MVKWLNPRQFSLTGRGIIMGAIDAVYDLIRVKLKIFLSFPLMDAVATPSCKSTAVCGPEKIKSGQLKKHVLPLLQVHNHMLTEFLVETFRWVKLLVSTWVLPTLV